MPTGVFRWTLFPGSVDEGIPSVAVIDDIVVGFEVAVREPVVAHVLPDVFNGIEFRGFRRQGENGDVGGNPLAARTAFAASPRLPARWLRPMRCSFLR